MSIVTAPEAIVAHPDDEQTYAMDFTPVLHGRTISSVSSISATSGYTANGQTVNSTPFIHDKTGKTIPASHAVLFNGTGGIAGTDYTVTIAVTLSDGKSVTRALTVQVRSS